jgi:hypothetical protein
MSDRHTGEQGQALAFAVVALVAILAMVGLIVDGGNAWAQQRLTQNAADAAAEAGAIVLVQMLADEVAPAGGWDGAVSDAVNAGTTGNNVALENAWYTDWQGNLLTTAGTPAPSEALAAVVGAQPLGLVPPNAQGVMAAGSHEYDTYIARIIGQTAFTNRARATAVAGALNGGCDVDEGCAILPVTFPISSSNCDGTGRLEPGVGDWEYYGRSEANAGNEAIVPLCKNKEETIGGESAGSVGWLDFGCAPTLEEMIENPCPVVFNFNEVEGVWVPTKAGNANSVEDAMNTWAGPESGVGIVEAEDRMVMIPRFDGTCKVEPPTGVRESCPADKNGVNEGVGARTWYHIPSFAGFILDQAYIQGRNTGPRQPCSEPPGSPAVEGTGSNGCLKGWFSLKVVAGPVGPFTPGDDVSVFATQLIR